jgi:chromosome segregation ATPase
VANKRAKIDKLKAENASVERDVTRFNEREALRATAAEMKTKVPWLVFGQAKTQWADAKTKLAALKRNIIAEEDKLKHLKTPMVKARDELDQAVVKHKKCAAARKSSVAKQRSLIDVMEKEAIDHEAIALRLQRAKEDSASRSRRIKEREKKLRDAEAARERGPSLPESNDDELKSLRARRVEMNAELRAVEEEHEELCRKIAQPQHTVEHASRRLAVLNSVRGQRLVKAREVSKRQRLAEFDEYVRENANYFVKPVLGPILTLMECADPTHRNMLSQSINNTVFGAYVVQTKADYDKVHGTARAMKCDVYLVDKVTWTEPDVSHLASLGVTHRLDQTFDAPAVIKTVLCNVASLHKAYALKPMPGAQVDAS